MPDAQHDKQVIFQFIMNPVTSDIKLTLAHCSLQFLSTFLLSGWLPCWGKSHERPNIILKAKIIVGESLQLEVIHCPGGVNCAKQQFNGDTNRQQSAITAEWTIQSQANRQPFGR